MLNCRETIRLASESLDRKLTFRERLGMKLHLWMCRVCANFAKTFQIINSTARRFSSEFEAPDAALPDEAKAKQRELVCTMLKESHDQ